MRKHSRRNNVNPSHFEVIPTFPEDGKNKYSVHAIIETPRNLRHKYALEPEYGIFKLKTIIAEGLAWPYDYGFIPRTLGDDGDPLDVLFLSDEPTFAGCLVEARLLGSICLEKNGEENDRLLAAAVQVKGVAQTTDSYKEIDDVPQEMVESMTRFLVEYSSDADNKIVFKGVDSRKKALASVKKGMRAYSRHRSKSKGK